MCLPIGHLLSALHLHSNPAQGGTTSTSRLVAAIVTVKNQIKKAYTKSTGTPTNKHSPASTVLPRLDEITVPVTSNRYQAFAVEISKVAAAVHTKPVDNRLQQCLDAAKHIPDWCAQFYALKGVAQAMQFLSDNQRKALFSFTLKIVGKIDVERTLMNVEATRLLRSMVKKTSYLKLEVLKNFIDFIVNYDYKFGRTVLVCALAEAAEHGDERLHPLLIDAMTKKKEADTLDNCVLRVLQIAKLTNPERTQLTNDFLSIHQTERIYMLDLLASRLEYLALADQMAVVDAIRRSKKSNATGLDNLSNSQPAPIHSLRTVRNAVDLQPIRVQYRRNVGRSHG